MHPPDPHRQPLLHTPNVQVDACACGHIHLTVGVITLRFEIPAFLQLVDTLARAASRLERQARPPWPTPKLEV